MQYFIGRNEVTADDLSVTQSTGTVRHKKNYGDRSLSQTAYKFGSYVVLATDGNGNTNLMLVSSNCGQAVTRGEYFYSYGHREVINLKYVPKRIKEASYPNIAAFFDAVGKFITESKNKAETKRQLKKVANETNAAVEMLGLQDNLEECMQGTGYDPTPAGRWYRQNGANTMNDWYRSKNQYSTDFRKDRRRTIHTEFHRGVNGHKITIDGVPTDKLQEILKAVATLM